MLMFNLKDIDNSREIMNIEASLMGKSLDVAIDEVALLTMDHQHWTRCTQWLFEGGWDHFNTASDIVHTEPFGVDYEVEYAFFRRADTRWRVELMHTPYDGVNGYSPLHMALRAQHFLSPEAGYFQLPVVHLSYKVLTEGDLESEEERLQKHGYLHGQSCRSTYGWFSYWRKGIVDPYVKPRVNTRDRVKP